MVFFPFYPESPTTASVSSLQPPPTVDYLENGQICINCSFSGPLVKECVVIIHSTHNNREKKLKVFSIETSIAYHCQRLTIDKNEYRVAVFGLLSNGLERVPVVKTFIRRKDFSTTPSGQFKLKVHIRVNMSIIVRLVSSNKKYIFE